MASLHSEQEHKGRDSDGPQCFLHLPSLLASGEGATRPGEGVEDRKLGVRRIGP